MREPPGLDQLILPITTGEGVFRLLGCGDRKWTSYARIASVLDRLYDELIVPRPVLLIEGEADGADLLCKKWAGHRGWDVLPFPADWRGPCQPSCKPGHRRRYRDGSGTYCPAAGPYRNVRMLREGRPHLVVAFHEELRRSKGTWDMVTRARRSGVAALHYGLVDDRISGTQLHQGRRLATVHVAQERL